MRRCGLGTRLVVQNEVRGLVDDPVLFIAVFIP